MSSYCGPNTYGGVDPSSVLKKLLRKSRRRLKKKQKLTHKEDKNEDVTSVLIEQV